jgi:amidohydrolase
MKKELLSNLKQWRHILHANPELSGHESETSDFVGHRLAELGIPFVHSVGKHGIVATLTRGSAQASVGLRADMDALAVTEENDFSYKSENAGVMHACGHDGHTVSLLGAAALLANDDTWQGTVHFIFEPSEENGEGAKAMIKDGLFERFPMDRVFTFHNWPGLEVGSAAIHHGPVMAAGGGWHLRLRGKGGHAAMPHRTRDPIVAAGHLIVALQTIVSRTVDPADSAVLSIGSIHGGSAHNQIPSAVSLIGTLRTYKPEVRRLVEDAMQRIGRGVAASFDMEIDIEIRPGGLPVINSQAEADLAVAAAVQPGLHVRRDLPPSGAGDDFSRLIAERPGAYVWIGNGGDGEEGALHNPRYDFNDDIIPLAVGWMTRVAKLSLATAGQI